LLSTVFPSLELVVSKSANKPFISSSEGYPFAELSIDTKMDFKSVFRFGLVLAVLAIFTKS
jgi:hypothetical protein